MGRSWILKLLVSILLFPLFFSPGFSRKVMQTVEFEESTVRLEEFADTSREMIEVMDYKDPGPNINPKTGYIFSPPPQG